jgi:hypothetical protein
MPLPYKLGSSDLNTNGEITKWQEWFARKAASYAPPKDGYYGNDEVRAVEEMQRRYGIPITGVFDQQTASRSGYTGAAPAHRPIWIYSAAGTGGRWWQGPQFDSAEWCKTTFNLNHQPVDYPAGGFLGLTGGDPGLSYNESIAALDIELERMISACPDLNDPNLELWFFGYSQSADGIKHSVVRMFGDGGKYEHLRSRINGLVLFGDPTRAPGPTKVGNNPAGWGISRWDAPEWVDALTWSITNNGDMYACTTDDTLIKLFYPMFVRAEADLPFVMYVAQIIIPAMLQFVPIVGGLLGPAISPLLAGMTGMAAPLIGQLVGGIAGADSKPDPELIKLLSIQGILTNLPALIKTLIALQGIAIHGDYWALKPEFGNRSGVMVACDIVKDFRRLT